MPLTRLAVQDFRSYREALLEPGPGLVILTGENGAGKTNLLEAVSLLAPGRGLRGAALSEIARQSGPGGFAVSARLSPLPLAGGTPTSPLPLAGGVGGGPGEACSPLARPTPDPSREREGSITLGTGTLAATPERRQVRINGAPAAANALAEWLSVLWLTPAMDRLFTEGAGGRRRFLDRLVLALEPGHATHAARYEAAMRARNKLLAEPAPDLAWLAALEARMAEHGQVIAEARDRTIAALGQRLAAAPNGPFARAGLRLDGRTAGPLAEALRHGRARDAAAGRTLTGPHRSDLQVTHLGKQQPAALCSTGEQKALLLGLILAHADLVAERTRRRPILLLDEVAAHLDPRRRGALFERLGATGGQVWMTGTERRMFEGAGADATWLEIAGGRIA